MIHDKDPFSLTCRLYFVFIAGWKTNSCTHKIYLTAFIFLWSSQAGIAQWTLADLASTLLSGHKYAWPASFFFLASCWTINTSYCMPSANIKLKHHPLKRFRTQFKWTKCDIVFIVVAFLHNSCDGNDRMLAILMGSFVLPLCWPIINMSSFSFVIAPALVRTRNSNRIFAYC